MPDLRTKDGETLATDLTVAEIERLTAHGVDVDATEADAGADGDGSSGEDDEADPDDVPDEIREREADLGGRGAGSVEEKYDVDDPMETTDADERRFERYRERRDEYDTDIETFRRKRDEYKTQGGADRVKKRARKTGLAREVEEKFRQYVTRDQPRPSDTGRRIDRRNAVRRAAGDYAETDVYEYQQPVDTGDRCIGVALDASYSMKGRMLEDAKLALAAIAKATETIGDEFVAASYTDTGADYPEPDKVGDDGLPKPLDIRMLTGPNESFDYDHLTVPTSFDNTPTAAGAEFTKRLMDDVSSSEDLLIVLTDGQANVRSDGSKPDYDPTSGETSPAITDCRAFAEEARQEGCKVVGVGIGSGVSREDLAASFGENHIVQTEIDDLADELIRLYEATLDEEAVA